MMKRRIHVRLLNYFFRGILLIVPIALIFYVIYKLVQFIDNLVPLKIPGLGILILIVSLTLIGFLGSTFIAQPIIKYFQRALDKAPLVKTIYTAIKDLLSAFVGSKKKFDQPVLVKLSRESDLEKPGFITRDDLRVLGIEKGKVAVYLPHSYNFSGNLFIVPADNVRPLNVPSADVMKFIVSGGVTEIGSSEEETNQP